MKPPRCWVLSVSVLLVLALVKPSSKFKPGVYPGDVYMNITGKNIKAAAFLLGEPDCS